MHHTEIAERQIKLLQFQHTTGKSWGSSRLLQHRKIPMLRGEGGGSLQEEQNQGLTRAVQLMYPSRAKSISSIAQLQQLNPKRIFPHWNPQFLGSRAPPTAQTGHALGLSNPDKQWLHNSLSATSMNPLLSPSTDPGNKDVPRTQHVDPQDLSSLQLELTGQQGGRSVAAAGQPCPPSHCTRAVSAAPARDTNCAPADQAGPGSSRAHANSASRGRLLANSIPRGLGTRWLLESSSRTACLPKAGARGCLHHRKIKSGDTWKPH